LEISKLACKFIGTCCCGNEARRIVTTFEIGRNCSAAILKAGVSCIEAISQERVI
jgi:hypothetical protein